MTALEFGKRGGAQETGPKGFEAMDDAQILGRFYMSDTALRESLYDWAEIIAQQQTIKEDGDRIDALTAQIQERVNEMTKSDRGSKMTREGIDTYVRQKISESV